MARSITTTSLSVIPNDNQATAAYLKPQGERQEQGDRHDPKIDHTSSMAVEGCTSEHDQLPAVEVGHNGHDAVKVAHDLLNGVGSMFEDQPDTGAIAPNVGHRVATCQETGVEMPSKAAAAANRGKAGMTPTFRNVAKHGKELDDVDVGRRTEVGMWLHTTVNSQRCVVDEEVWRALVEHDPVAGMINQIVEGGEDEEK